MPEVARKIGLMGCSVPVDSGSVIDFTCYLARKFDNTDELVKVLQNCNSLKALEAVHLKCQPGWLLSQWCPEVMDLPKSDLPKSEFAINIVSSHPSDSPDGTNECPKCEIPSAEKELNTTEVPHLLSEALSMTHSKVVDFWQTEDELCVGADVKSANCTIVLDVHSCFSLQSGSLIKLVAWYDRDVSFCKRILDLMVYMRYVDHS
uniref:Gp_dh_C domain-containing protein n=1 Tax=Mesocestoides corti TaxID=53468 RepID=A0A5K3EW53_MESCO